MSEAGLRRLALLRARLAEVERLIEAEQARLAHAAALAQLQLQGVKVTVATTPAHFGAAARLHGVGAVRGGQR
jgi:hypothetical protein